MPENRPVRPACAGRMNDLKTFAEKGEATEEFSKHAAACPGCRAAVEKALEEKEAEIERLENERDRVEELRDEMESVIGDIDAETPPSRSEVIIGRVVIGTMVVVCLAVALIMASMVLGQRAEARDWRLSRQVENRVKTVLPDPVYDCHADHRLLCEMTGDQDACSAARWYRWLPTPAPAKAVCIVEAYFSYRHPDRPNFYVIDGDTAVGYRLCGRAAPPDCPRPAKEILRQTLPPAAAK